MEKYEKLERSAQSIGAMTIVLMLLLWFGAILVFFMFNVSLVNAIWLFLGGVFVGLIGEAASSTMMALAEHMKDDYITRKCMERLVSRLDRSGAQK